MKKKINLDNWERKEHFLFFKNLEESFYGITVILDCTKALEIAKKKNIPFYIYYLHKTIVAVNKIENFRYRIIDDKVYLYDEIHVSATVLREDKTFGFSFMKYYQDEQKFYKKTQNEIKRVQQTQGLITTEFKEPNLIHFSAIPWLDFTSLSHARSYSNQDSCPKISFGKLTKMSQKLSMPVSIHVHHGFVDGYHVGLFVEELQNQLNQE